MRSNDLDIVVASSVAMAPGIPTATVVSRSTALATSFVVIALAIAPTCSVC